MLGFTDVQRLVGSAGFNPAQVIGAIKRGR